MKVRNLICTKTLEIDLPNQEQRGKEKKKESLPNVKELSIVSILAGELPGQRLDRWPTMNPSLHSLSRHKHTHTQHANERGRGKRGSFSFTV